MKEPYRVLLLYKEWPFWVSLAMLYPLNMEIFVMPFWANIVGLSGFLLFLAAVVCTTIEISYWYWFAGWLYKWLKETPTVKSAIKLGEEEIAPKMQETSIKTTIRNFIMANIVDPFNPAKHEKKGLFVFLKGLGYVTGCLTLFFLGITPVFWLTGLFFCRGFKWETGLYFLIAGNVVKNYGLGMVFSELWSYLGSLV